MYESSERESECTTNSLPPYKLNGIRYVNRICLLYASNGGGGDGGNSDNNIQMNERDATEHTQEKLHALACLTKGK